MSITASVFIATSLDGFIARNDGSMDWLLEAQKSVPADEDCGYAAFMGTVDVIRQGPGIQLETCAESPVECLRRLSSEGCQQAYVDGGRVIQSFLSNDLIDTLTITTNPVLIGEGRSLFGGLPNDVKLKLVEARTYAFGFLQASCRIRTDA